MTLQQLLLRNQQNNIKLVPSTGAAASGRDTGPLAQLLMMNFELSQFRTTTDLIQRLNEAMRNPQLMESLKTQALRSQPPQFQEFMVKLLIKYLGPDNNNYISAFKNIIMSDISNSDNKEFVNLSNLSEINGSDVGSVVANTTGVLTLTSVTNASVTSMVKTIFPKMIIHILNMSNGDQMMINELLELIYTLLVSSDGFVELCFALSTLSSKASTVFQDASKSVKTEMAKSGFGVDMNAMNNVKKETMPLKSLVEVNQSVDMILTKVLEESIPALGLNQQMGANIYNTLKQIIFTAIPTGIVEDLDNVLIFNKPVTTSVTDFRKIHLNANIVGFLVSTFCKIPNLLSKIIAYAVVATCYKNDMNILDNTLNINQILIQLYQSIGLNINIQNPINIGNIGLSTCIEMDLRGGSNMITLMYGHINNDKTTLALSQMLSNPNINYASIKDHYVKSYKHLDNLYRVVNIESFDAMLGDKQLHQFTTISNINNKPFIECMVLAVQNMMKQGL